MFKAIFSIGNLPQGQTQGFSKIKNGPLWLELAQGLCTQELSATGHQVAQRANGKTQGQAWDNTQTRQDLPFIYPKKTVSCHVKKISSLKEWKQENVTHKLLACILFQYIALAFRTHPNSILVLEPRNFGVFILLNIFIEKQISLAADGEWLMVPKNMQILIYDEKHFLMINWLDRIPWFCWGWNVYTRVKPYDKN